MMQFRALSPGALRCAYWHPASLQILRRNLRQILHVSQPGQQTGVIAQLCLQRLQFQTKLLALFARAESALPAFAVPFGGKGAHDLVQYH